MFNLNKFVKDTIDKMIGEEPDYKVMQYSLSWLNEGVLEEKDLADIQAKIDEKNRPVEIPEMVDTEMQVEDNCKNSIKMI